jgi:tetratricopeptide (TPR) repeat protein
MHNNTTRYTLLILTCALSLSCLGLPGKPTPGEQKQENLRHAQKIFLIGKELMEEGKIEEAKKRFEQAFIASEKEGYVQGQLLSLESLAFLDINSGNVEEGLKKLEKALSLIDNADNKIQIASLLNLKGTAHAGLEQYEKALATYYESLRFDVLSGNILGTAVTHNNLGKIHFKTGDMDMAMEHYVKALDVFVRLNDLNRAEVVVKNMNLVIQKRAEEAEKKKLEKKSKKSKKSKSKKSKTKKPSKKNKTKQ